MLFSSIPFLYYFLPAVLIVYFLVPKCLKNTVLLLFSLLLLHIHIHQIVHQLYFYPALL